MSSTLVRSENSTVRIATEDAAYIAGFVDGEGTLTLLRSTRKNTLAGFRYIAYFGIANTNLDVLKWIQERCGNGRVINKFSTRRLTPQRRELYALQFSAEQIRRVLPHVRPFLHVKAQQADLVLEALALVAGHGPLSSPAWDRLAAIRAELRQLNQRAGAELLPDPPREMRARRFGNQWTSGVCVAKQCRIEGCAARHYANGYCRKHHYRFVDKHVATRYEKHCEVCGQFFVAKRSDTVTCSKRCGDRRQFLKNKTRYNEYKRAWRAKQSKP